MVLDDASITSKPDRGLRETKYILWFDQINKDMVPLAGGKGANMGEMVSIGLPVPEGFVITTKAFDYYLEMNRLNQKIKELVEKCDMDDIMSLKRTSDEIKNLIVKSEYPATIKDDIKYAYEQLSYSRDIKIPAALSIISAGREYANVAVRSSATTEDLATASFAGQQASFLNIKGVPAVYQAVKECWASLFEPRAIFYRYKNGFTSASICVIIQRMVESEKSGVTFSVHPSTGENVVIHESVWGLGEALVLGEVQPDHYVVSKEEGHKLISKSVGHKEIMHVRDAGTGETVIVRVPRDKVDLQVMSDSEIGKMTEYAMKLEEHYGKPQDIEWAVKGPKIYIVQTRPITTVSKDSEMKADMKTAQVIEGKAILKGLAASPGIGIGVVRVVHSLEEAAKVQKGDILVTEMTSPDYVPAMSKSAGIVTDKGGQTSHAAIVSREMGIPCVVGTQQATKTLKDGQTITVDGTHGTVYDGRVESKAAESEEEVKEEEERAEEQEEEKQEERRDIFGETEEQELGGIDDVGEEESGPGSESQDEDGPSSAAKKPKLYMNLGVPEKIDDYSSLPFDGIGLMRVEFIIAGIGTHPNKMIEDGMEQEYIDKLAAGVERVASKIKPRPVVVRFSDFKTNEYKSLKGGEKYEPEEANPMIGWRGVSRYVMPEFEQAFRLECRAMRKVRETCKNVWVMLPFVRTTWEVGKCLDIMEEEGLKRGDDDFKVWIMAEVPSVVMLADEFSQLCDGFSIGSNDLTQLTLGVDRDSEILGKAGYFDERDPAVKASIKHLIDHAHRHGCTVSICGQAPSEYPEYVSFLMEHGVDSVSVNPDVVRKTKEIIDKL
jgi:pyruvate, water dikinase